MKRHCKMRDQRTRIGCICANISVLIVCILAALVFSSHIFFEFCESKANRRMRLKVSFSLTFRSAHQLFISNSSGFSSPFCFIFVCVVAFFYICSHSNPLLLEFQHKLKLESCFFRSSAFVTLDCCKQCHDEKKIHQLFFWFAWKKIPALIDFLMNDTKKNIFNAK